MSYTASLVIQLVKKSACNAGDPGLIPGSGRFPGEGNGYPLQYSCMENPMDRGAWQVTVHGLGVGHEHTCLPYHTYILFSKVSSNLLLFWKLGHLFSFSSVQFICSAVPTLQPHGLQHARPPCPSPTPGACSNSWPLNQWCHWTVSSSVVPFSSCPQSFPASGSFQMSQFFASGGQSIGASASASVLPMNIQYLFSSHYFKNLSSSLPWSITVTGVPYYLQDGLQASYNDINNSLIIYPWQATHHFFLSLNIFFS